jgi:hypothetical protein
VPRQAVAPLKSERSVYKKAPVERSINAAIKSVGPPGAQDFADGGQAAPYNAGDVGRVIETLPAFRGAESVRYGVFSCPATGARGLCGIITATGRSSGRAHPTLDRAASDLRLSTIVGLVAFRRGNAREPQGRLSRAPLLYGWPTTVP